MSGPREQNYYGNGNHQQFHNPPPPPPQHRNLVPPEMSRPPAYQGQQVHYPTSPNPFNDSNAALSQRSSVASSVMGGPGMVEHGPRHDRTEALRGYSDSVHSGSSDSGTHGNADHFQRGHRSPGERGALMGTYAPYSDNPYNRYSSIWDNTVEQPFNPDEIADDGDDGLGPPTHAGQRSASNGLSRSNHTSPTATGAGIVEAGVVRNAEDSNPHGVYGPVSAADQRGFERSQMLAEEAAARKRKRKIFVVLAVIVILAVITAGTVAGVLLARKNSGSASSTLSASQDDSTILTSQSSEIQALMNNKNLHRVFPGMDYTPFGAQYPDCLTYPPSQNNVTRDVAVLSQLTNVIRLYGTDCNQTDMVLESLKLLGITDMKVWLGVWLDSNQTTNNRGMNAMWDILSRHKQDPFEGVIIGNEVLYRKDLTLSQLSTIVDGVRSNFTTQGYTLPIAIADLGDNWTAGLVQIVDVVMSNVHPFFAGVSAETATAWTINFWKTHDVALTTGTSKQNIIAETGWPSEGGKDCGNAPTCDDSTPGAVASVNNMNKFMSDFVCSALQNKTNYFWFEAFDEPWKQRFNTAQDQWETRWGLMDPGRNLKPGLSIPDCGGQTVARRR